MRVPLSPPLFPAAFLHLLRCLRASGARRGRTTPPLLIPRRLTYEGNLGEKGFLLFGTGSRAFALSLLGGERSRFLLVESALPAVGSFYRSLKNVLGWADCFIVFRKLSIEIVLAHFVY